jgi:hypothetical protein
MKMIKPAIFLFALMAVPLVGVATARAQAGADACGADVEKYCKDVPVGGGRRYRCLKEHEKELSEPCRKHIADVQGKVRGIHEACWDDVSRLCGGVRRGGGRILQCLKDHESELSDPCKAALAPPKK